MGATGHEASDENMRLTDAGPFRHALLSYGLTRLQAFVPAMGRRLRDPDTTLYLDGDWCLGPRVEAAWTSGTAIAQDLLGETR